MGDSNQLKLQIIEMIEEVQHRRFTQQDYESQLKLLFGKNQQLENLLRNEKKENEKISEILEDEKIFFKRDTEVEFLKLNDILLRHVTSIKSLETENQILLETLKNSQIEVSELKLKNNHFEDQAKTSKNIKIKVDQLYETILREQKTQSQDLDKLEQHRIRLSKKCEEVVEQNSTFQESLLAKEELIKQMKGQISQKEHFSQKCDFLRQKMTKFDQKNVKQLSSSLEYAKKEISNKTELINSLKNSLSHTNCMLGSQTELLNKQKEINDRLVEENSNLRVENEVLKNMFNMPVEDDVPGEISKEAELDQFHEKN